MSTNWSSFEMVDSHGYGQPYEAPSGGPGAGDRSRPWEPRCSSAVGSSRLRRPGELADGRSLPSDLLGLTSVRYDPATSSAEVRAINQKLRKAIETEGRRGPVEGLWWPLSLTVWSEGEPSAVSLLRISRDRDGGLNVTGRAWQEDGTLSARLERGYEGA